MPKKQIAASYQNFHVLAHDLDETGDLRSGGAIARFSCLVSTFTKRIYRVGLLLLADPVQTASDYVR